MLALTLREPVRGAIDGLPSPGEPHPWRGFVGQVTLIVPPLTLIGAARRGGGGAWRSTSRSPRLLALAAVDACRG